MAIANCIFYTLNFSVELFWPTKYLENLKVSMAKLHTLVIKADVLPFTTNF